MKILGTTQDVTMCDCCGRMDLKKTVIVESENGVSHYGVVCAATILKLDALEVKRQAASADKGKTIKARRLEAEKRKVIESHPLYLKGIAMRDELTKEFGFWSRAPKDDPRTSWFGLLDEARRVSV